MGNVRVNPQQLVEMCTLMTEVKKLTPSLAELHAEYEARQEAEARWQRENQTATAARIRAEQEQQLRSIAAHTVSDLSVWFSTSTSHYTTNIAFANPTQLILPSAPSWIELISQPHALETAQTLADEALAQLELDAASPVEKMLRESQPAKTPLTSPVQRLIAAR